MRARGPEHGLAGTVGDRGVQAAATVAQRSPLQAHLRHIHRLQEHRVQDRQRTQTVTTAGGRTRRRDRVNYTPSPVSV